MEYKRVCIFALCVLTMMRDGLAVVEDDVTRVFWDGVGFYIPVTREAIQTRLDEWHEANSNVCESPRLFLPNYQVFPELMGEDQHPIYIDFGDMTFYDFDDGGNKENPLVYGIELAVTIPLLTAHPDGPPSYSLALAKFYERSRGDFPKPNMHYPYIPADKLTLDDQGASIQIGVDEMRVIFERQNHPCVPPPDVVRHEFDEFVKMDLHLGTSEPNFGYCYRHPTENQFCATAERLRCAVSHLAPNLCQFWRPVQVLPCATSVEVVSVTDYFREFMLFGDDDPINVVSSETFFGNFTIGFKYPCME